LSESRQKVSSLAEQLDAKTTVNSITADGQGSENGSDDVSALKVCAVELFYFFLCYNTKIVSFKQVRNCQFVEHIAHAMPVCPSHTTNVQNVDIRNEERCDGVV